MINELNDYDELLVLEYQKYKYSSKIIIFI